VTDTWSQHETLEEEVVALTLKVRALEVEVKSWKTRWKNERDHRLRIGAFAPEYKGVAAPRLFTVEDANGNERMEWLYTSEVLISGLGIYLRTFTKWITAGYIPESPFRGLDGKRLWTKSQVELILRVVDKHRVDGRIAWSTGNVQAEIAAGWEHVGNVGGVASRKRHRAGSSFLKKGEQYGTQR
jgi:hypothetical protein